MFFLFFISALIYVWFSFRMHACFIFSLFVLWISQRILTREYGREFCCLPPEHSGKAFRIIASTAEITMVEIEIKIPRQVEIKGSRRGNVAFFFVFALSLSLSPGKVKNVSWITPTSKKM